MFANQNIEFVFLKGAALLITNPYNVVNDRMIGDIDILVSKKDIDMAEKLLIENNFKRVETREINLTEGIKDFEFRHIDRLVSQDYIAAVELHHRLLTMKYDSLLTSKKVLESRVLISDIFPVPSNTSFWEHIILNWQINDKGFRTNSFSFRALFDSFYFQPKDLHSQINSKPKVFKHFYSLASVFNQKKYNYGGFRKNSSSLK